jgi:hypothetical protein
MLMVIDFIVYFSYSFAVLVTTDCLLLYTLYCILTINKQRLSIWGESGKQLVPAVYSIPNASLPAVVHDSYKHACTPPGLAWVSIVAGGGDGRSVSLMRLQ